MFIIMVIYESDAQAFFGIWNRKSDIGLVGNTINTWTGVRDFLPFQTTIKLGDPSRLGHILK